MRLNYPVHPDYDFQREPEDQASYANPVTVSNKQLDLANALIQVTTRHNELNTKRTEVRQALAVSKAQLEDFELALWSTAPPPASERKTIKLMDAYTRRLVAERGGTVDYQRLVDAVRAHERELVALEGQIENCRQLAVSIKQISENGRTYLAYVKDEARRAGLLA